MLLSELEDPITEISLNFYLHCTCKGEPSGLTEDFTESEHYRAVGIDRAENVVDMQNV